MSSSGSHDDLQLQGGSAGDSAGASGAGIFWPAAVFDREVVSTRDFMALLCSTWKLNQIKMLRCRFFIRSKMLFHLARRHAQKLCSDARTFSKLTGTQLSDIFIRIFVQNLWLGTQWAFATVSVLCEQAKSKWNPVGPGPWSHPDPDSVVLCLLVVETDVRWRQTSKQNSCKW